MSAAGGRGRRLVVAIGAQVRFRGRRWQVIGLAGQQVHLAADGNDKSGEAGSEGAVSDEVVLAGHLFADPDFQVVGAEATQAVPRSGLFATAPKPAREKALAWLRHIREVETGLPDGPDGDGMPRPEYDPQRWTLAQREQAKAEELTALGFGRVSRATVQRMRLAYRRQGLWGLVDHRSTRAYSPTGRADERVVAAIKEVLRRQRGRSKGTISALLPKVTRLLEERHGAGVVAPPSQASFYRLVHQLAAPTDLPGRPVGTPPLSLEGRAFTPTVALRPGEQVQIDTTRLDVLALFEDGTVGRPELTIAIDVATRAILAAVLCPAGTRSVDAALLLAEMTVPHPARPTWPDALRFAHSSHLPQRLRLMSLDERLQGAAARPVAVPETIVVDRGRVFLSQAFTAACETLGISVQLTPPFAPTAKGIVERAFGTINAGFCQHLPGYTGPDVTQRGPAAEGEACLSVAQLQDLLDEWLVHYHHRPHEGLRHPRLPKVALSPNQMWAALVAIAGHVPVPLTGTDYLELLPVRWQAITPSGIRINHRTYDHDLLAPYRGQTSGIAARNGKWEVHYNPHDARQIWIRLPDQGLVELPWIHRDHTHWPFDERTWQHIRATTIRHPDRNQHEADLADALDHLMRRAHTGNGTRTERAILARTAPVKALPTTPPRSPLDHEKPPASELANPQDTAATEDHVGTREEAGAPDAVGGVEDADSLDDLDHGHEGPEEDTDGHHADSPTRPYTGLGLYDPRTEALTW
ncbi:Mu transposase C-terminal domain-containing protein [Streptomyces mayteni]